MCISNNCSIGVYLHLCSAILHRLTRLHEKIQLTIYLCLLFYIEILALLTRCSQAEKETADEGKHIVRLAFITAIFKCLSGMYKLRYSS
jgi:hypothetical protein